MIYLFFALIFLGLQGLYSGMETGMVSVLRPRASHAARKGNPEAKLLMFFQKNSGVMISTALIAVNICVVLCSLMTKKFLESLKLDSGAAMFFSGIVLSLLLLITEIIPKNWFREASFQRCSRFIRFFYLTYLLLYIPVHIFAYFTDLLNAMAEKIRRKKDKEKPEPGKGKNSAKKDFRLYLYESRESGEVDSDTASILDRAIDVPGMLIENIMIPPEKIRSIPESMTVKEACRLSRISGENRFPVYAGIAADGKRWTGVFDIYEALFNTEEKEWGDLRVRNCMRPLTRITAGLSLGELLKFLRTEKVSLFAVTDPNGRQLGIIRPDDVASLLFEQRKDDRKN